MLLFLQTKKVKKMLKSNVRKYSILLLSIFVLSAFVVNKIYDKKLKDQRLSFSIEKSKIEDPANPYYIDQQILNGKCVNTSIIFMNQKANYYFAQRALDEGHYDESLSYLNNITMRSFDVLKNDLKGDVYFYKKDKKEALNSYSKAISYIQDKDNQELKESIYSKYQMLNQIL